MRTETTCRRGTATTLSSFREWIIPPCANIVSSLNVEFAGHGVGDAFLKIEQVGIEVNSGQKPVDFNYRCFVDDPDNHLYGTLYYHIVKSNVGADNSYFKADGGAHLKAIPSF